MASFAAHSIQEPHNEVALKEGLFEGSAASGNDQLFSPEVSGGNAFLSAQSNSSSVYHLFQPMATSRTHFLGAAGTSHTPHPVNGAYPQQSSTTSSPFLLHSVNSSYPHQGTMTSQTSLFHDAATTQFLPTVHPHTLCETTQHQNLSIPHNNLLDNNLSYGAIGGTSEVTPKIEIKEELTELCSHPDQDEQAVVQREVVEEQLPEFDVLVHNVVSTFSVRCHLNLRKVAMNAINAEYKKGAGRVLMKLRKPKVTASIWSSGKITSTGAGSNEDARKAARRIARILQKIGFPVRFAQFKIINVLATSSLPFGVRLPEFANNCPHVQYEPELHPAAVIRPMKSHPDNPVVMVFSTGSMTVTARSIPTIRLAIQEVLPDLLPFKAAKHGPQTKASGVRSPPVRLLGTSARRRERGEDYEDDDLYLDDPNLLDEDDRDNIVSDTEDLDHECAGAKEDSHTEEEELESDYNSEDSEEQTCDVVYADSD